MLSHKVLMGNIVEDKIDKKQYDYKLLFLGNPLPNFFIFAGVQHNLVWVSWSHTKMAFGPIVGDSVSKDAAVPVECTRRNGTRTCVESCYGSYLRMERSTMK